MYICQAIKKAVSLSPQDHTHWNVLGIIAAQPGELNLSHYLSHSHPLPSISSATAVAICMCGVFFFCCTEVTNPALAQHAFVRSIQEEPNVCVCVCVCGGGA